MILSCEDFKRSIEAAFASSNLIGKKELKAFSFFVVYASVRSLCLECCFFGMLSCPKLRPPGRQQRNTELSKYTTTYSE